MSRESPSSAAETRQDAEHLRLLSIFHYVVAGMQALFASFPILHFAIGAVMVFLPQRFPGKEGTEPPLWAGLFFMLFAGAWMLVGWTLAVCTFVAGRSLARRKRYVFCLVMAGICAATCMPFGTVLGVFTIIVLLRPSVRPSFETAGA
jgi:hypothetical protein